MSSTRRDPLVGGIVDGRYEVRDRLARGGMSTVYRAVDLRLDREVALKVMHPHLAEDPALVGRFEREAKTAARLSHPHVVAVLDQGHTDDGDGGVLAYLVMELVPGHTLRTVVREDAPLTPREALAVLAPAVDGLAAAHRAGLVHRDVKPENVLVSTDGRITVADFGLSRAATTHTATGQALVGTPAYLAPELITGGTADARADVYAAGIVLFELLTGRQPYPAATPIRVAYRHVHERVPVPSSVVPGLPEPLDDLVLWCTEPDPADRPADAGALLTELRSLAVRLTPEELDHRPHGHPVPVGDETRVLAAAPRHSGDPETAVLDAVHGASTPRSSPAPAPSASPAPAADPAPLPRTDPPASRDRTDMREPAASRARPAATPRPPRPAREGRRAARRPEVPLGEGAGRTVAIGTAVTLLLTGAALLLGWTLGSGGAPLGAAGVAVMPALEGLDRATAEERLAHARVAVEVSARADERYSDGTVAAAAPAAGAPLAPGTRVELTVSTGPAPVSVPDLTGSTIRRAHARAAGGHLRVSVAERRTDREVPAGTVLLQTPAAGAQAAPDSAVRVVVSAGPGRRVVPELGGQDVARARAALEELGFTVRVHEAPLTPLRERSPVVARQSPAAGTELDEGTAVEVWGL
uniref:Stk1 family PASTA domain-containing Ser/Thr kinase n=1 Tax=uncultured Micrococcus sp. TaxID=114051 RepID=UPI00260FB510|nr:Stk1 family PASTA domain-containing Ser/Thr kinase [uncultured Micrococcus sp.]